MKRKRSSQSRQTTLMPCTKATTTVPPATESGECPVCGKVFPSSFLSSHVSFHFNDASPVALTTQLSGTKSPQPKQTPSSSSPSSSAFDILRNAQKKLIDRLVIFRLDVFDDKLHPVVVTSAADVSAEEPDAWTAEISMKQVTVENTVIFPRCKLRLCTTIPPASHVLSTNVSLIPAKANNAATIAILKSMMQKAFRRRKALEAARIALYLCRFSVDECLRRMLIIIIEDGALHAGYPIIAWSMMAQTKGYLLPDVVLSACIAVFAEAANSSTSDYPVSGADVTQPVDDVECGAAKTLLHSVLFRAAYGGMAHDIVLLVDTVKQWAERFCSSGAAMNHVSHPYLHTRYVCNLRLPNDLLNLLNIPTVTLGDDTGYSAMMKELYTHIDMNLRSATMEGVYALSHLHITANDLEIAGIDHIADRQLVPHIVSRLQQNVELEDWRSRNASVTDLSRAIERCIGTFRSFVNTRQTHNPLSADEQTRRLEEKRALSGLWRLICPIINEYCSRRMGELVKVLRMHSHIA